MATPILTQVTTKGSTEDALSFLALHRGARVEYSQDNERIKIIYNTISPNQPPFDTIKSVSAAYPNLVFYAKYSDEGGSISGWLKYINGELKREWHPRPASAKAVRFANEIWEMAGNNNV